MNKIRYENLGERWALHIVKSMSGDKWVTNTKYYHPLFIAAAVLQGAVLIVSISKKDFFTMAMAIALLLEILIYFERWYFTCIIKRQQEQIDSLNKELNTIKLGK